MPIFPFRLTVFNEHQIDRLDVFNFFLRTGNKDHTVSLETLSIAAFELAFRISALID
jgi:hypothetical protein